MTNEMLYFFWLNVIWKNVQDVHNMDISLRRNVSLYTRNRFYSGVYILKHVFFSVILLLGYHYDIGEIKVPNNNVYDIFTYFENGCQVTLSVAFL